MFASGMLANVSAEAVLQLQKTYPARAAQMWQTTAVLVNGLGGGNEIVGGLWLWRVSIAGLRAPQLPRLLGFLGLAVGTASVVTSVPALAELGAVFGVGLIAWFAWMGVVLLRMSAPAS